MNATNQCTLITTFAGILLFATMPFVHAAEATLDLSANGATCSALGYTQMQDLKLAEKAQEGVDAFVKYVHLTKTIQQWSIEEALVRAKRASITPCGVAMGLKPIDDTKFATAVAANSR